MKNMVYKKRRVYFENHDFELSLEEADGHLFVHLIFFDTITKGVILKVREVFNEVKEKCYWLGYEQINTYTTDIRVAKLFEGWEYIGEVDGNYKVVRWVLK